MISFLKKKEPPPTEVWFDDLEPAQRVEVKGVVIQAEKALGVNYGGSKDFFHILVKVDTPFEYSDSNGYVVIKNNNEESHIPLAKVGDKVTFDCWTGMSYLTIASFTIDFSARKADVE